MIQISRGREVLHKIKAREESWQFLEAQFRTSRYILKFPLIEIHNAKKPGIQAATGTQGKTQQVTGRDDGEHYEGEAMIQGLW